MPLFVVCYDLKKKKGETRDYSKIEEALQNLDSVHTQGSVWYVDREGTAEELFDHLSASLRDDDPLMIVPFSKKPKWRLGKPGTKDWIKKKFP